MKMTADLDKPIVYPRIRTPCTATEYMSKRGRPLQSEPRRDYARSCRLS
jgi:hypothetical protein